MEWHPWFLVSLYSKLKISNRPPLTTFLITPPETICIEIGWISHKMQWTLDFYSCPCAKTELILTAGLNIFSSLIFGVKFTEKLLGWGRYIYINNKNNITLYISICIARKQYRIHRINHLTWLLKFCLDCFKFINTRTSKIKY